MTFYIIKLGSGDFDTPAGYTTHLANLKAVLDLKDTALYEATLAVDVHDDAKPVKCKEGCTCHKIRDGNAYKPPNFMFQSDPKTVQYQGHMQ